ncbi:MAG: radical SAM protein, partial [Firmicutes bacterium]|nr:radical SAM protein [Bacillota bacterium]
MYPLFAYPHVLIRQYGDSVIYRWTDISMEYEPVNKTGAEILELCDGAKSVEQIAEVMSARYGEDFHRAKLLIDDFINACISRGYVIIPPHNEDVPKKGKIFGEFDRVTPMAMTFELTRKCPLACKHCYISAGSNLENEMNFEEVTVVLDKLKELGISKLFLTGGEPAARPDFIQILEKVSHDFVAAVVATSGYLFSPELVRELKNYKNIAWQVSVDGMGTTHNLIRGKSDAFQRADYALKSIIDKGMPAIISFTLNPINRKEMEEVVLYGKEIGAVQVLIGRTLKLGRAVKQNLGLTPGEFEELDQEIRRLKEKHQTNRFFIGKNEETVLAEKAKEQKNCGAGYIMANILPNGDVTPCTSFHFKMGNLLHDSVDCIFASKAALALKDLASPTQELCGDCQLYYECDGCHGLAYNLKV